MTLMEWVVHKLLHSESMDTAVNLICKMRVRVTYPMSPELATRLQHESNHK